MPIQSAPAAISGTSVNWGLIFERLYLLAVGLLRRYASSQTAGDIAQEALARYFTSAKCRPEDPPFFAYLFGIMKNVAREATREYRRIAGSLDDVDFMRQHSVQAAAQYQSACEEIIRADELLRKLDQRVGQDPALKRYLQATLQIEIDQRDRLKQLAGILKIEPRAAKTLQKRLNRRREGL
jgi:DNA-directed RNA polymerase specialized sigma24 family protein